MHQILRTLFCVLTLVLPVLRSVAQTDTIKVMTYNVLNYGDQCQGPNTLLHSYLKTIVADVKPDLIGLVKMSSIKLSPSDINNFAPYGFADSIIVNALNPGTLNSFSYCPLTNISGDDKTSVLFYNNAKLGYISTTTLSSIISDFNLYKLFYKDPNLTLTKDTTFLYIVLNHTQSGDDATTRNQQEAAVLASIKKKFYHLPNLIMMGDFNIHNSSEQFYQNYTASADTSFLFFDPPFSIDNALTYPADWDNNPNAYASYLTTSTRQSASYPNTCGTDGGAKSWYDHILLSSWIKNNSNYISYILNSYCTIGNDGKRVGISINDSTTAGIGKNNSASTKVINALFQLSNKYPASLKLLVNQNTSGQGPTDPVTSIGSAELDNSFDIIVKNPVVKQLNVKVSSPSLNTYNNTGDFILTTTEGKTLWQTTTTLKDELIFDLPDLSKGIYLLHISAGQMTFHFKIILDTEF
jgi:hypothetical protein